MQINKYLCTPTGSPGLGTDEAAIASMIRKKREVQGAVEGVNLGVSVKAAL